MIKARTRIFGLRWSRSSKERRVCVCLSLLISLVTAFLTIQLFRVLDERQDPQLNPIVFFGLVLENGVTQGPPFFVYSETHHKQFMAVSFKARPDRNVAYLLSNPVKCVNGFVDGRGDLLGTPLKVHQGLRYVSNVLEVSLQTTADDMTITCEINSPARLVSLRERRLRFTYLRVKKGLEKTTGYASPNVSAQAIFALDQDSEFENVNLTGHSEPFLRIPNRIEQRADDYLYRRWTAAKDGSESIDADWIDIADSELRDLILLSLGISIPLTLSSITVTLKLILLIFFKRTGSLLGG